MPRAKLATRPKPVGTGALKIVERKLGQSLHYERVEDHWRHTPEFKELEFSLVARTGHPTCRSTGR